MLCSQINFLIKAVNDRKLTKIMKRTANVVVAVAQPPFRKFDGKTVQGACTEKALAKSLASFKPKSPGLPSQKWFLCRDDAPVRTIASV
jgi:hypothetical protein